MSDAQRAFRDYVTRVSFNLTMSRNQVAVLRQIVLNMESAAQGAPFDKRAGTAEFYKRRDEARQIGIHIHDGYIVGLRWLTASGLVESSPEWLAEKKRLDDLEKAGKRGFLDYDIPSLRLTEAGEHVVALLRIAGLIPQRVANANTNRNKKRARRAA